MPRPLLVRPFHAVLVALAVTLSACGAPQPSQAPAPVPAAAPAPAPGADVLTPPEAALRVAADAQLTGTELGTMWTFENPPLEYWRETYGFTPPAGWLDHVRLSSVRFGQICSASFVSPDGLVMTNWHCAESCAEALSSAQEDLVEAGFYAPSRAQERVCPDLWLDQLLEIEDVTARVRGAAPAGAGAVAAAEAQEAEQERIVEACEAERGAGHSCEVVTLFHGGQYQLYAYRRFQPVKLVFIPEKQAGFYGGDPDNFTYPRYNLDVAFVRAYGDDDRPLSSPDHFGWDADGAAEGELVFVVGNPGGTSRLITVSELLYEQSYAHPLNIAVLEAQSEFLHQIARQGPEAERAVREDLFTIENSLKAFQGQLAGLQDTLLVGRKIVWERELRERVAADPALRARFAGVWDSMAVLQARKRRVSPVLTLADAGFQGLPPTATAGGIVAVVNARALPEAQRPEELRGEALEAAAEQLASANVPPYTGFSRLVELHLELIRRYLPADHPVARAAFRGGETTAQAAQRIFGGTRLGDPAYRRRLLAMTPAALDTVSDPLLALARAMDEAREGAPEAWEELTAAEQELEEELADAAFAVYGTDIPPDATFTLRISDGVVARYPYNGTFAPPHTTFLGLWNRARGFNNEMPWTVPPAFQGRQEALDMETPLNFVTTNDITGGSSGSPMIDAEGRIVGIAFDSNIEGVQNEFLYRAEAGRAVGVHSAGIIEALRSIYGADALVAEILSGGR